MQETIRFSVYEHTLVISGDQLISRKFIVLRNSDNHIVSWTNFHKYIFLGRNRISHNILSDGNMRFYCVCMLLNYAFFDSYHIRRITDLDIEIVKCFLNDYGMGDLQGDREGRSETTVNTCICCIMDFLNVLIEKFPDKIKFKKADLYKEVQQYNRRTGKVCSKRVPVFNVYFRSKPNEIFRDIPESVFSILLNVVLDKHKDILMLVALGAFAGMRPSECCNVRRHDSKLGAGIRFVVVDGEIEDIIIDLRKEQNLRSDLKSVGGIKKERTQRVYPAFLKVFYECYLVYMEHIEGKKYESDFGALTVNKQGKAMTYDNYYKKFKNMIRDLIPELLASNDPEAVNYGYLLQEKNISPHIFRHWFSVMLTLFGEDISGLMFWRGDRSPESALVYLQNKGDLEKKYRKVNNELFDYNIWRADKLHRDG